MPAIGAVLNGAVSEGKTINLYYNTPTAQVALALKSGNSHPDDNYEYWAADASDFKGHVLNPSEVAAVQFRGVATVVAATVPNVPEGETPTVNNISLVSPVYQMLTTTSLANCKVAMASSGEKAWVYFLSGSAKGSVALREHNMVTHTNGSYLENQDVTLNSSLAAWYDAREGQRLVVYQEVNQSHLKEFNIDTNQTHDIDSTSDARPLTTFCATYYAGKVYLYYTDYNSNLRRVVKTGSKWSSSERIMGSPKVAAESQLTVVTANKLNHVFYVSVDNLPMFSATTEFTHIRDEISA